MTHDEKLGTVVRNCLLNCVNHYINDSIVDLYHPLPLNSSELNYKMCSTTELHGTGRLCGKCKKGFQKSVYQMKCIKCSISPVRNWTIYLCVTFIPITIFFMFILAFRINVSTPIFMKYVLLCQGIASPTNV